MGFYMLYIQVIILHGILLQYSLEFKLLRTIQGKGQSYYKMLLSLGDCKENIIFKEQKSWHAVRLNRIIDIYYKSSNDRVRVSRVEITLIINNTNCLAYSETGVNRNEFSATISFSTNMGLTFYALILYTCDKYIPNIIPITEDPQLPFYVKNVEEDTI